MGARRSSSARPSSASRTSVHRAPASHGAPSALSSVAHLCAVPCASATAAAGPSSSPRSLGLEHLELGRTGCALSSTLAYSQHARARLVLLGRARTYGAGQLSLSWLGLTDGRCCLDDGERDARGLSHGARQLSTVERSARACTLLEVSVPAALASLHRLILSSPSGLTPSSRSTLSFRTGAFFCFAGSDRRCTLAVGMDSWARSGPSRDVFSSVGGQPPDASLRAPTPGFGALPRRLEQVGSHVDRVGRRLERGAASARARGQVRARRETGPCTVHLPSPGPGGPASNGSGSARRACVRSTGCFER